VTGGAPSLERPLSEAQRQLVERRVAERAMAGLSRLDAQPDIPIANAADHYPVSFAQERLWLFEQLAPRNTAYNCTYAYRLVGPLDITALERALREIVRRHEILRVRFPSTSGVPVQVVDQAFALPFIVEEAVDVHASANAVAREPFDLVRGPLIRCRVLRIAAHEHVLLLGLHHIVTDAWSRGIIFSELQALYEAFVMGRSSPLDPVSIQYKDYATWQRADAQLARLDAHLEYWRTQLADLLPLALPTSHPRPRVQSFRSTDAMFDISRGTVAGLKAIARSQGATLFMVVLAAFKAVLSRYSEQIDFGVGTATAGRGSEQLDRLVGCFINTVVIRTDLSGDPSFEELVRRVCRVTLDAYDHQDLPFEQVLAALRFQRDLSRSSLIQVMFVLLTTAPSADTWSDLTIDPVDADSGMGQFDLTMHVWEDGEAMRGSLQFATDLFDAVMAQRLIEHFLLFLEAVVATPTNRLSQISLLTSADHSALAAIATAAASPLSRGPTVVDRFRAQARLTPKAIAVDHHDGAIDYAELERRANRLANHLRVAGVGPEQLVAIYLPRSIDVVVAILAVLEAGGAYVPLDPSYPETRLEEMVANARPSAIVTVSTLRDRAPVGDATVISLDSDQGAIAEHAAVPPRIDVLTPDNLAYVLYTSGSTGRPKGVAIRHRSVSALLDWALATFTTAETAAVLASTSVCFDLSVFEVFVPLCSGGRVVLVENALGLTECGDRGVTLVNTVPSAVGELLALAAIPPSVRTITIAGEALSREVVDGLYGLPFVERVYNLYGPTEDTTFSTCMLVERGSLRVPSIGCAIRGSWTVAVDERFAPTPAGLPGELMLGGAGLARGYVNQPGLTAARFIPDPFSGSPGERLYRTGDWVRRGADGALEFIGRRDEQIKLRGFRIELGEIEAALRRHPGVRSAAVVVHGESTARKSISAYAVLSDAAITPVHLRMWLRQQLPEHMIPARIVMLDVLPLTPSGKINRQALVAQGPPTMMDPGVHREPARTPVERALAAIWATVLGMPEVGIRDNFFALGGHSLLATQAMARARQVFQRELPLRALFEYPTIAELATALTEYLEAAPSEPVAILPNAGRWEED
jgi:amino acid adenylation domain-containing protein